MKLLRRFSPAALAVVCVLWVAQGVQAQPAQVAHLEGSVALSAQGDKEWMEVEPGRALRAGDRLWTDPASRLELHAGRHLLRVDAGSHLAMDSLHAGSTQMSLRRGSLMARVPALGTRENFEIDTPNLAFRATAPGRFRVDVDAKRGVTQVSVLEGKGTVFGAAGEQRALQAGQNMAFAGRALAIAAPVRTGPADAFERWALARDRSQAPAAVARSPAAASPARTARAPAQRGTPVARAPARRPAQAMGAAPMRPAEGQARQWDDDDEARERAAAQRDQQARAQQRRRDELAQRDAWLRQRRAAEEQYWRQQQEWLRYQHGGPPPGNAPHYPLMPGGGIPARRVG